MKRIPAKLISVVIAAAMVISGIPVFSAAAAGNDEKQTITAFVYDNNGKTPKDDVTEYARVGDDAEPLREQPEGQADHAGMDVQAVASICIDGMRGHAAELGLAGTGA